MRLNLYFTTGDESRVGGCALFVLVLAAGRIFHNKAQDSAPFLDGQARFGTLAFKQSADRSGACR